MKILILLLVTLAAVNAMENFFSTGGDYADEKGVVGEGCCQPTQWEGRVGAVHVFKKLFWSKVRISDSKIGFDFDDKKVAARTMYYCSKTKRIFTIRSIADFKAHKAYFIYNDKCKTYNYPRPLVKPCIPDSFKKFSSYYYGASTSSLALTPYGYRKGGLALFSVVTKDSCVPIKAAYRVKGRFQSSMGKYQYFNITLGNTDKDLYNVPSFCNANENAEENRSFWRKFRKFAGYNSEEPFKAETPFGNLVQSDAMSQIMEIIDTNAMMLMEINQKPESVQDKWYQKGWDHVESRLRQYRDRVLDD